MGFIRGALAVLIGVLLFVSILSGAFLLTLSSSLKYENVKEKFTPIVDGIVQQGGLTQELGAKSSLMKTYCNQSLEYVFKYQDYTINVPCNIIFNGTKAIVDYGVEKAVEQTYYKEYNCEFIDCFKSGELPVFLISEKARDYFISKFYFVLFFFILLSILMFVVLQKKSGILTILGSFFVVASLIIWKIGNVIIMPMNKQVKDIVGIFFSTSYSVFIKMLIIGVILVVFGISFRIAGIGMRINEFFSRMKAKEESKKKKK
ncbi:MAG: hypothetical protein Q7S06_03570 [Nanoarchaeota archaeon]|nr:hypothetical protein [Nanoarchaeota archaeon]